MPAKLTKSKPNTYKLTRKHLNYFRKRVRFWQNQLGIVDLEINAFWDTDPNANCLAQYHYSEADKLISICLAREWDIFPKDIEVDKAAFHEVFESGYLYPLRQMARTSWSEHEVNRATHSAVRKAEHSLFMELRHGN